MKTQGPGRPMKYRKFLEILEDHQLYSAAMVVRNGEAKGLFRSKSLFYPDTEQVNIHLVRLRIRHTLARFATNHCFPKTGDGLVMLPQQAPVPGWFGWRWKQAMR